MTVIEEGLASSRVNMLNIMNMFEQIVWRGGYKMLSKEGIEKFRNAQALSIELFSEFSEKVRECCYCNPEKGEGKC